MNNLNQVLTASQLASQSSYSQIAKRAPIRPNLHLIEANKISPNLWKIIDSYRQENKTSWPQWCFLPSKADFLNMPLMFLIDKKTSSYEEDPSIYLNLPLLSAWRATQGVYRFDPDVLESLWNTSIKGSIPTDVLYRIPEWCVYVETGERKITTEITMHGFFAGLDYDLEQYGGTASIVIFLDVENKTSGSNNLLPVAFSMESQDGTSPTIEELIAQHMFELEDSMFFYDSADLEVINKKNLIQGILENTLPSVFSLILYLCAQNAEFQSTNGNAVPSKPAPTKTKKGLRYFPPNQPTVWLTAWRIGASIRSHKDKSVTSSKNGLGGTVRPHVRRAHWQSYWIGHHDGERSIVLKWLMPIFVNVDSTDDLIPAVRGVE